PMDQLNSTTYTTITINLAAPGIPYSLGEDGNFDLGAVNGYAILGDVGLINGATNVPFALTLDEVFASSLVNSSMEVTGTVNLGGSALNVTRNEDFNPTVGQQFTIVNNDGVDPVVGTFAGIAEGGTKNIDGITYKVSYVGGDGNDVVLTVDSIGGPVGD